MQHEAEYPRLCGPLLSASTFASCGNSASKSLLYAVLAIKSKHFFSGATVTILFTLSQHCVFLFLRKSSGI